VHLGHQQMIGVLKRARRSSLRGDGAGVRAEFQGVHRSGRCTAAPDALAREVVALKALGVDRLVTLRFDEQHARDEPAGSLSKS
jgi:FAD synthase